MRTGRIARAVSAAAVVAFSPLAANASWFKTIFNFDHKADGISAAQILFYNGRIYGVSTWDYSPPGTGLHGNGNLFSLDPATGKMRVEYRFTGGATAQNPYAVTAGDGVLYGLASGTNSCDCGAIFSFNLSSAAETVLYSFVGGSSGAYPFDMLYKDGNLFGLVQKDIFNNSPAGIFEYNTAGNNFSVVKAYQNTHFPNGLVATDKFIYGYGGAYPHSDHGPNFIFSLKEKSNKYRNEYTFSDDAYGYFPSGFAFHNGELYGTMIYGGTSGAGTIYGFDPKTKAPTVLYNFQGNADGAQPVGGMVYIGGKFYGTTSLGGIQANCSNDGCGTIYEFDPSTLTHTVLYSFTGGADASQPYSLITDGTNLYGATNYYSQGGATIWEYQP